MMKRYFLACVAALALCLPGALSQAQTVDGQLDASYGAAKSVQTTPTQFGDANAANNYGGSELDAVYAHVADGMLYLLFTGNLEKNGNGLEIFFDTQTGGQTTLATGNPVVGSDPLGTMAGLTFDADFAADYYIGVSNPLVSGFATPNAYYAPLSPNLMGLTLIEGTAASNVPLNFDSYGQGTLAIDDTNQLGVTGGTDLGNPAGVRTGYEMSIPLSALGDPTGTIKICAFINGTSHNFVSNQVLGGLALGTGNLGGPTTVNFGTQAGSQYFPVQLPRPIASLSTTLLDLSSVVAGQSNSRTLRVRNTGAATLNISSIGTSNPLFTVTPTSGTVAAGDSLTVTVTFSPTATGAQTGTLTVRTDDADHATLTATLAGVGVAAPTASVDGMLDANGAYGAAAAVQTSPTGFGDVSGANMGGSELDAAYTHIANGKLYLLLTGNLETNGNDLEIFFDTRTGGLPALTTGLVSGATNGLDRMAGLRFDTAFVPDYFITVQQTLSGTTPLLEARYAALSTQEGGMLLTSGATGAVQPLSFGGYGTGALAIIDTNQHGVSGTEVGNPAAVRTGIELEIPLSVLGNPTGQFKISAFVNGGSHDYISNQVLGGLVAGTANLGDPATVSFAAQPGHQYFNAGVAPTPNASLSASSLDLGTVTVGSNNTATFVIRNRGTAALTVSGITSSNGVFTATPATGTLAAGDSLTVTVRFSPTAPGTQSGTLTIATSDAAHATLAVAVTGNGTAAPVPVLSLSATALSLGSVTVGSSGTATFYIRNRGTASLSVTGIASSNAVFTVAPATATLAVGDSVQVTVTFMPTAVGPQTSTLTITSNAGSAATVSLTGTGAAVPAPGISVSRDSLMLGSVVINSSGTASFYLRNTGNAPLSVTGITSSNALFTATPATATVAGGDSVQVTVTFSPTAVGAQTGTLTIASNAGNATVALTGTGTAAPVGILFSSTQNLVLGSVAVGSTSTATFTVRNTGTGAIAQLTLASSNPLFTLSPASFGPLAAGDSVVITVTFAPTADGDQSGTITVTASNLTSLTVAVSASTLSALAPAVGASLRVYPNPATQGQAFVEWSGAAPATVQVLDALGRTVRQETAAGNRLSLAGLGHGVYTVRLSSAGSVATRKLVVE